MRKPKGDRLLLFESIHSIGNIVIRIAFGHLDAVMWVKYADNLVLFFVHAGDQQRYLWLFARPWKHAY